MSIISRQKYPEAAIGMTSTTGTIPAANQATAMSAGVQEQTLAQSDNNIFSNALITPGLELVSYRENLFKRSP